MVWKLCGSHLMAANRQCRVILELTLHTILTLFNLKLCLTFIALYRYIQTLLELLMELFNTSLVTPCNRLDRDVFDS